MTPPGLAPEGSRGEALRLLEAAFARAGLAEPGADAAILLEEATGLSRSALRFALDVPLGAPAAARLESWAARRLAREPVFRIVGRREFWGLSLRVTPDVLDPRPDTETVVEAVLRRLGSRRGGPLRLLDLGTGSGALLCALLHELPDAAGIGVDRSPAACAVARGNLASLGLDKRGGVVAAHWTEPLAGRFDVVVSNPPYIAAAEIAALHPEVRDHDPRLALDGGPDGLDAYRAIAAALPGVLAPGGVAALEVGHTQAFAVAGLLAEAGLAGVGSTRDLGGHERVVLGAAPA